MALPVNRSLVRLAFAGIALSLAASALLAGDELLGAVRVNNRTESVTFRIAPRQARVSEIRIRSGSLAASLSSVEVEFADGGLQRTEIEDSLAPGMQSRPIAVDARRAMTRVSVMKRPGLRPGETSFQLLGRLARP